MGKEHPIPAIIRKNKSPGFCPKCNPYVYQTEEEWGHKPKNCRNPPFCTYHNVFGHRQAPKCRRHCTYCRKNGHTMQFCHKLKNCDLCGKNGHNPYRCWRYRTLSEWAYRAKELNRCMQCLTLCTVETNCIGKDGDPDYRCQNCNAWRTYWNTEHQYVNRNCKESQTETNPTTDQESQSYKKKNLLLIIKEGK